MDTEAAFEDCLQFSCEVGCESQPEVAADELPPEVVVMKLSLIHI